MQSLIRFACLSLVLLVICPSYYAQEAQKQDTWRKRSLAITDDLLTDAAKLTSYDKALLWTRMAHTWWRHDTHRARDWMRKAVDVVIASSDSETKSERQQRMKVTRAIFPIIAQKDKALSARLMQLFTVDLDRFDASERAANAQALSEAASTLLDTNTQQAFELGKASLRTGQSYQLTSLLWGLRARNSQMADSLFIEALQIAQVAYDRELLSSLVMAAFPHSTHPNFKGTVPSDQLRVRLLNAIADGLLRYSTSAEARVPACQLASLAVPLMEQFYSLLPLRAGLVRNALAECQPQLSPTSRQRASDLQKSIQPKTIEDYLELVEKAPNLQARIDYWMRAVFLAKDQQKNARAIDILDGMSIEARETLGDTWAQARWDFALIAALDHLKRSDLYAMDQVISATPANLRPMVQVLVAEKLVETNRSRALELMREARTGLDKVELLEKADTYILLTQLYSTVMPQDALSLFSEAITAINRADRNASMEAGDSSDPPEELWQPIALPAVLLDVDEIGLRAALASVELPTRRIGLRLGLLESSVQRIEPVTNKSKSQATSQKAKTDGKN